MRIAFFADHFYPELSGISDSIILVGKELSRRGHSVEYFVPSHPKKHYDISGVPLQELNLGPNIKIHRGASFPYKAPSMQGRALIPNILRGIFSQSKFDIIHSHSFFGAGLDALCFSKIKGVPLVGTNDTLIEAFIKYGFAENQRVKNFIATYIAWYYNACDFVTTPSQFLLNDMKEKGLKAPATAVSNPIENEFFNKRAAKDVLKKELGFLKYTVLYAGRISSEKNVETLLEAFIAFAKNVSDTNLVIVGHGSSRAMLEDRARKSSASSQIKIVGPFLGDNKHKLYDIFHASDVFVMPSVSETQSMVTLQAMAGSMPVLVARAGSLPELVDSGQGFIFEPKDFNELSLLIARLYENPALREEKGLRANVFAKSFSQEEIVQQWEKIYLSLIKL